MIGSTEVRARGARGTRVRPTLPPAAHDHGTSQPRYPPAAHVLAARPQPCHESPSGTAVRAAALAQASLLPPVAVVVVVAVRRLAAHRSDDSRARAVEGAGGRRALWSTTPASRPTCEPSHVRLSWAMTIACTRLQRPTLTPPRPLTASYPFRLRPRLLSSSSSPSLLLSSPLSSPLLSSPLSSPLLLSSLLSSPPPPFPSSPLAWLGLT